MNEIALLAVLPGALAVTLAFAPEPATRLGTMAKDLLCIGTAAAPLCGTGIHVAIAAVPALLAVAVLLDRLLPPGLESSRPLPREACGIPPMIASLTSLDVATASPESGPSCSCFPCCWRRA
ncbi:hypothetical protein [Methylobacterium aquaticum]|uniref:Uncharacterized protein n=1 Tax=Methylobacterium aquaticum TaxID=270351 RepID=A0A0J6STH6_9HYPH|nr:hypothetical protein [Methylobacterium aquaticum]KMO38550.1 hypothetical protein VP06_06055 [Methylobacterium aquaticum]